MFRILGTLLILYKIALINIKILFVWSFFKFFKASSANVKFKDIRKLFNISLYQEFFTFYLVDKVDFYKRLLARVTLEKEDKRKIILDLVIISKRGIYTILTSDRKGEIKGNCESLHWVENYDGKHNKFYNPMWLNETNIDLLSKKLDLNKDLFISVVIFKKKPQLSKITNIPQNVLMTKKDNVKYIIESDYKSRGLVFEEKEVDEIFDELKKYVKLDNKLEEEHYRNIEDKFKQ